MINLFKDTMAFLSVTAFCVTMFVWMDIIQNLPG